jgi:hypothetical protein
MSDVQVVPPTSKGMRIAGWILSILPVPLMAMGAIMCFHMSDDGLKEFQRMHWEPWTAPIIGTLNLIGLVLYLIPQTAVLGAIVITGYLGGAVATHLQAGETGKAWMPVVFGAVIWLGLVLRDSRVRSLLPIRKL